MKNNKKTFSLLTILLAVLAVCLLLVGGIGVTRAVLIESETYSGTLETPEIAAQLNENGKAVSGEDALLQGLLKEGEAFAIGNPYDEALTVTNTGSADQFVRVTLYRYWTITTKDGTEKRVDLDPATINLFLGEGWVIDPKLTKLDPKSSKPTSERIVVYYTKALAPGEESTPVLKQISASSKLSTLVKQTDTGTKTIEGVTYTWVETKYVYDGLKMNLEASADAIQTHHAQDAIKASWGATNVTVDEDAGTLSVN